MRRIMGCAAAMLILGATAGAIYERIGKYKDAERFLAGVTRFFVDPVCTQYMLIPKEMQNPDGARKGLELLIQSYTSPQPIFALTIADQVSDTFYGFCQLWPHKDPRTLEIVYAVI